MTLQVTTKELLGDKYYAAWFAKPPPEDNAAISSKRWVVWIEAKPGQWTSRRFRNWKKAQKFFRAHQADYYDITLVDMRPHKPPLLRRDSGRRHKNGQPIYETFWWPFPAFVEPGHKWCPYCRRPTVFRYYRNHHALVRIAPSGVRLPIDHTKLRCRVCGVGWDFVKDYYR